MTRPKDTELKAIGVCVEALKSLENDDDAETEAAQWRVLGYLNQRFNPPYTLVGDRLQPVAKGQGDTECDHPWHGDDNDVNRLRQCPGCNAVFVGGS